MFHNCRICLDHHRQEHRAALLHQSVGGRHLLRKMNSLLAAWGFLNPCFVAAPCWVTCWCSSLLSWNSVLIGMSLCSPGWTLCSCCRLKLKTILKKCTFCSLKTCQASNWISTINIYGKKQEKLPPNMVWFMIAARGSSGLLGSTCRTVELWLGVVTIFCKVWVVIALLVGGEGPWPVTSILIWNVERVICVILIHIFIFECQNGS